MNIFALDQDPAQAARWHTDKHVVKMILESAQILCSVFHLQGIKAPYKLTHENHPCCKWARESLENFSWLFKHSYALHTQYQIRYKKTHKTFDVLAWIAQNKSELKFKSRALTPFAQAMPEEFKYKNYYKFGKKHLHKWKLNRPEWI